jgi:hypothetical protein
MTRPTLPIAVTLLLLAGAARAQDVVGIEACSREARMDRRTGCLQSNVEYLHALIGKNAADAAQKLNAAAAEIGALKGDVAALRGEVAGLRAALAAAQAAIEKLQQASRHAPPSDKSPDRPADKPAAK